MKGSGSRAGSVQINTDPDPRGPKNIQILRNLNTASNKAELHFNIGVGGTFKTQKNWLFILIRIPPEAV
jgi:hypothetical protein